MDKLRPLIAEFIGTFALIFVGIGAIHHFKDAQSGLLGIALAHGLTIAVMVSATGHISGGHLNPAVTFGLFVGGKVKAVDAGLYWIAQLAGAVVAGYLCLAIFGSYGTQVVQEGTPDLGKLVFNTAGSEVPYPITAGTGILVEAILTFFLVFVVFGTGVDVRGPKIGGLAIGLTVALDILFGGPLTGAAMNPARTFGPAVAANFWNNHCVYWVGPLLGGGIAGALYGRLLMKND